MSRVLAMRFDSVRNALVALLDGSGGTKALNLALATTPFVGTNPQPNGSTPFQLTKDHARTQVLNPAGAITVKLPTTGIQAGEVVRIDNRSINLVTVQSSGANAVDVLGTGYVEVLALVNAPTTAADWLVRSFSCAGPSYFTGTVVQSTSTTEASPSSWTTGLIRGFLTSAIASGGGVATANGTLTMTFARVGQYLALVQSARTKTGACTKGYLNINYGGTATTPFSPGAFARNDTGTVADANSSMVYVAIPLIVTAAAQTFTVNPSIADTFSGGSVNTLANTITILPLG